MANMTVPRPFEPEKSDIHDRTKRPAGPAVSRLEYVQRWWAFALSCALSVGATALLFSIRDSWGNHREWLVTTIPFLTVAAIALVYLTERQKGFALAPGLAFVVGAVTLAGSDILVDREPNPSSAAQDTLSILGGISLGAAVVFLVVAFLVVEIRNPTKAPAPEL